MSGRNNRLCTWLVRNMPEGFFEKLVTSETPSERERIWVYRDDPFSPLSWTSLTEFDYAKKRGVNLTTNAYRSSGKDWPIKGFNTSHIASLGEPRMERTFVQLDEPTILDRYGGRLTGLCTTTQMFLYPQDDPKALLPDGLRGLDLVDVTDGLTDAHIANIPDLRENDPQKIVAREYIANATAHDVKMIVLTGDRNAVSKTMDALQQNDLLASKAHFVPQTAQLVAEQLGFGMKAGESTSRDRVEATIRYYHALRAITLAFEAVSRAQAKAAGKGFLIANGGTVDHVGDPLNEGFADSLGSLDALRRASAERYDTIIALDPVWSNPSSKDATVEDVRRATEEQARSLKRLAVLEGHPGFRYVLHQNDAGNILHEVVFGTSRHS